MTRVVLVYGERTDVTSMLERGCDMADAGRAFA